MDGTLWDSSEGVAHAWNRILAENRILELKLTKEDIMGVMGRTMTEIGDILFSFLPENKRYALLDKCMAYENLYLAEHGGTLYPELLPTLHELKELAPLFIVSNCQAGYIEAFLDFYGLHSLFTDHLCFGDNDLPKDKNIRLLARRNALDRYYYVGDIEADRIAAVSGGAKFIHAAYGFGTVSEEVPSIQSFPELPALVSSLLHAQ